MKKYCVIGKSLPHTLSPEIHRALGNENYDVVELESADALKRFVVQKECEGFNVTIPYKRDIMPMLDEIDAEALDVGAVNTVVMSGGRLKGYNTDVKGMTRALEMAKIEINSRHVLILGSGGTGHTANYVCRRLGAASVDTVSRTGELNYTNCYERKDVQVIINATPVGMFPQINACPIDVSKYDRLEGVFDCIYNPTRTRLLNEADMRGINACGGMYMLVEQARLSHNLFMEAVGGEKVGREKSEEICSKMLGNRSNIVLIGMAGCGKSSIGRNVAKALNMPYVDTDTTIVKKAGKSIPEIFSDEGEGTFRRLEREAVKEACAKTGRVIATGGGAPLDSESAFYMRSTGLVAYITRDAELLARKGRPLSCDIEAVRRLMMEREPVYRKNADLYVKNNKNIQDAADIIVAAARARNIGNKL